MNVLMIPAHYPHPAAEWVGSPNEYSAQAMKRLVSCIEVLAPRPYSPQVLRFNPRWNAYARIQNTYVRNGVRVHRPAYPVIPRIAEAFWPSQAAFVFSRRVARALHREIGFHAILSFDLALTGGLAWRLGRYLGIPACGWATGTDVRSGERSVGDALCRLDMVFYQTTELKALGAELAEDRAATLPPGRHIVQSRGVIEPASWPDDDARRSARASLRVAEDTVVILYIGRIVRGKGLFELVTGFASWAARRPNVVLVLVGSIPGFDEATDLQRRIDSLPGLAGQIRLLPACEPPRIWHYLNMADIFAFPSYREGMPNSLLEAMLAGVPAVAFSIPAVQEITRFGDGLVEVPAYDFSAFGDALLDLANDPVRRRKLGEQGRALVREHFSADKSMQVVVNHLRTLPGLVKT